METDRELGVRTDITNTETPRACHILALRLAGTGMKIPEDVEEDVISFAERGRVELREVMDTINLLVGPGLSPDILRSNFLDLAIKIVASYGIEGTQAGQRRFDHLYNALYKDEIPEAGVGFTE